MSGRGGNRGGNRGGYTGNPGRGGGYSGGAPRGGGAGRGGSQGNQGGSFNSNRGSGGQYGSPSGFRGNRGGDSIPAMTQPVSIDFVTNHFTVDLSNSGAVNFYRVDIEIPADKKPLSLQILREKRTLIINKFLKDKYKFAFDGDHLLVSTDNIPGGSSDVQLGQKSFLVDLVKVASNVKFSSVLSNEEAREQNAQTMQCLDIALSEAAGEKCTRPNARLCLLNPDGKDNKSMMALSEFLPPREAGARNLWMGHSQSVQKTLELSANGISSSKVTLLLNAAAAVAFDKMQFSLWTQQHLNMDLNRKDFPNSGYSSLTMKTRGLKFESYHGFRRTFKIVGIDPKKTAMTHKFEHEGKLVNVFEYFRDRYKITLKYPNAPLLQISPKSRELYIPAELVYIGRQNLSGKVSETLKKCVGEIMTMEPGRRRQYVEQEIEKVFGSNDVLKMLNIQLTPKMLECKGEIMVPPVVKYDNKSASLRDGKWNMQGCRFNDGKIIRNYGVINFSGQRTAPSIEEFFARLCDQASQVGMQLPRGCVFKRMDAQFEDISSIKQKLIEFKEKGQILDILFAILPERNSDLYQPIKESFDPLVPTQCLAARQTPFINGKDRGAETHLANILCKINMKLGGTNQLIDHLQSVDKSLKDILGTDGNTCVIGVDVCHPSSAAAPRGQDRKAMPSFTAVVASVDSEMANFVHLCSVQMGGVDVIESQEMFQMIKNLMEQRQQKSGRKEWPSRIVYVRDGVNEEAVSKLLDQEVNVIDFVYKEAGQKPPQILAVVVKKRHQTRFFPKDPKCDSKMNLPPGTLLLDQLTLPLEYDNFYLLSHAGIKGTSHPCRYIFVRDDFKKNMPLISKLSDRERVKKYAQMMYAMCHIYGRCQRSVSVPAPVFYAHLLADRARIHGDPICRKHTGLSSMESVSVNSGDGRERILTDVDIERMKVELKESMGSLSSATSSFFYC